MNQTTSVKIAPHSKRKNNKKEQFVLAPKTGAKFDDGGRAIPGSATTLRPKSTVRTSRTTEIVTSSEEELVPLVRRCTPISATRSRAVPSIAEPENFDDKQPDLVKASSSDGCSNANRAMNGHSSEGSPVCIRVLRTRTPKKYVSSSSDEDTDGKSPSSTATGPTRRSRATKTSTKLGVVSALISAPSVTVRGSATSNNANRNSSGGSSSSNNSRDHSSGGSGSRTQQSVLGQQLSLKENGGVRGDPGKPDNDTEYLRALALRIRKAAMQNNKPAAPSSSLLNSSTTTVTPLQQKTKSLLKTSVNRASTDSRANAAKSTKQTVETPLGKTLKTRSKKPNLGTTEKEAPSLCKNVDNPLKRLPTIANQRENCDANQANAVKSTKQAVETSLGKTAKVRCKKPNLILGTTEENMPPSCENFDDLLKRLPSIATQQEDCDENQVDTNDSILPWESKANETAMAKKFLESLSEEISLQDCEDAEALRYRKASFASIRDELAARLYEIYHEIVFRGRFPTKVPLTWNVRILTSGGFCYYRRDRAGRNMASITLSVKALDRPCRLRDTLMHEMCHAGAWLLHSYRGHHGPVFRFWAQRANLLLGLSVSTCHTYQIETKYVYRCDSCPNEVRRHSKSLDTTKFICSLCKGRFQLFINSRGQRNQPAGKLTPVTERKVSAFANFVKDKFKDVKAEKPHLSHAEVMAHLGERWKQMKINADHPKSELMNKF